MPTEGKLVMNSALPDDRPQDLKDKDYRSSELTASAVPTFTHSKIREITGATIYSQEYVGDCVPHGLATMLEYEGIISHEGISQLIAYRKRINYPSPGCIGVDMLDIIRAYQNPNKDYPTPPGFTEAQATAMRLITGTKFIKDFKYFQHLDSKGAQDFTLVPADVAEGKAVAIFIFATEAEWSKEYVEIIDPNLKIQDAYVRHCISIIPNGDFMEDGRRWLSVQDSAAFGGLHLRHIEYDSFFLKRTYFSVKAYPVDALPVPPNPQPSMNPTTPCQFNDKSDAVKNLQAFLVKEGKLEAQYVTSLYGPITAKAVEWWQLEHWEKFTGGVPTLLDNAGKFWGKESIAIVQ